MDRDIQPPSAQGSQLAPGTSASARNARNANRSISPMSRLPGNPATPGAGAGAGEHGDEADSYFPPLAENASIRSRSSVPSFITPTNSGAFRPTLDKGQGRQPSIRISRSRNGSIGGASLRSAGRDSVVFENNDPFANRGRPRSVSQPERAQLPPQSNLARHSRRVPQLAMPRLTEEGARPTMSELGILNIPGSPLSPSISLPEHTPGDGEEAGPERKRMPRARRMTRMLWPGNYRRRSAPDDAHAQPPQIDYSDEYAEQLVDWLDIIGMEHAVAGKSVILY